MKKWIISITMSVIVIVSVLAIFLYDETMRSKRQGQVYAEALFEKEFPNAEVIRSDHYVGNDSSWTLHSKGANDDLFYAFVNVKKKKVEIRGADGGISEKEAQAISRSIRPNASVIKSQLGLENNFPIWEVVLEESDGKLSYLYLSFETGELLKRYTLQ
ncbi:MAG: hypothetical protein ACRCWQ_13605 [Bacilli bacterium]